MTNQRTVSPNQTHQALRDEVVEVMRKYGDKLSQEEVLALMAQMVGMCIAFMDQQAMTPERAMKIVALNIESGNKQVIDNLKNTVGNA